jgi:hypothetical protein
VGNNTDAFINTRLQPGDESLQESEPFQRLAGAGKTVETVFDICAGHHRLKPGVNEIRCLFMEN